MNHFMNAFHQLVEIVRPRCINEVVLISQISMRYTLSAQPRMIKQM